MPNKMLIDATHPEETRVVVVRGNRVDEFDFESAQRKQLRGNIYLAKVTRVEPSLQAAFIEYGGNRHGFLAFSEIHPDYYQIPIADRQALIEADERAHREAEEDSENGSGHRGSRHRGAQRHAPDEHVQSEIIEDAVLDPMAPSEALDSETLGSEIPDQHDHAEMYGTDQHDQEYSSINFSHQPSIRSETSPQGNHSSEVNAYLVQDHDAEIHHIDNDEHRADQNNGNNENDEADEEIVESVGGDGVLEEVPERAFRPRRQYKIQEVIKRRQVMLVQVVKEERGNKGAALTTYLSLAGRYAVLMPNTARGGGISRKITSTQDRSRLKEVVQDLDVPEGMGIILRTAGASRTKPEIKRDFEYLIRMWETVRDLTLKSQAPMLVYEEGSLIKRSLRDLFNKEIEEVIVAGETGYREARDFMKMLVPTHTRAVKFYRDRQPLFSRMGVENQLDAMFSPRVQLRSGGYIVINQTEALVSIDVNSGRSTREHHIEDTALKTNLEAAEEVTRQLRLRDLAGLIVIDFIDMDEKRNNRAVERKLSDCLKHDRARIQVGRISHFGLLEMSRQRIRASVLESSTEPCPHCGGTGHVRSVASVALQLLRGLEEVLMKGATHNLIVHTRTEVALYVLNHKRGHLRDLENSFRVALAVIADPAISGQQSYIIDRGEQVHTLEAAKTLLADQLAAAPPILEDLVEDDDLFALESQVDSDEIQESTDSSLAEDSTEGEGSGQRRKRRRRRRGRGGEGRDFAAAQENDEETVMGVVQSDTIDPINAEGFEGSDKDTEEHHTDSRLDKNSEHRPRRRGRRGGRRRRHSSEEGFVTTIDDEMNPPSASDSIDATADLVGPSPTSKSPPTWQSALTPIEPQNLVPSPPTHSKATTDDRSSDDKPRRRSTIREKVEVFLESQSGPEATPIPKGTPPQTTPLETPSDEKPPSRRAGWWARRFGGG